MIMSLPYVAQQADHQQLEWLHDSVMSVLLDGAATDGQLAVIRTRLGAGSAAPVHVHSDEDETFILLEGEGLFWAGDHRFELGAGGVAFLPRGLPHAYRITADAEMLTICVPAGIEEFFRAAGWDLSEPKPAGWELDAGRLAAAAAASGQKILGPPLGPDDLIAAGLPTV
jgi:quercetin dioxygenase-like cupin family protein